MKSTLKLIPIVLLIISTPAILFAQDDEPMLTNQIKFSPTVFADVVNPGIEISYEKRHTDHYASELSAGWLKSFINHLTFDEQRGFRIAFEEKYFKMTENRVHPYLACQLSYLNVKYTYYSQFIKDTALMTPPYYDTIKVAKQTLSLNLKSGVQISVKRFVFEFSGGIGLKYKMVRRSGLLDVNAYETPERHPNVYAIASRPGNYFTLSVPLNVTIGYRF